jgi:hypothetical protein
MCFSQTAGNTRKRAGSYRFQELGHRLPVNGFPRVWRVASVQQHLGRTNSLDPVSIEYGVR